MSPILDIGRLSITLHGVAPDLAAAAVSGLEDALQRRLGGLRLDRAGFRPELRIGPFDLAERADAAALRDLIAARLVEGIDRMPAGEPEEVS